MLDNVTRRTLEDAQTSLMGLSDRLGAQIANLRSATHLNRVNLEVMNALSAARRSIREARLVIEEVIEDEGG